MIKLEKYQKPHDLSIEKITHLLKVKYNYSICSRKFYPFPLDKESKMI